MSNMAESKIGGVIESLNELENNLDSLNSKVSDMKKQLSLKTLAETDKLLASAREITTREAQNITNMAKERASIESAKIAKTGESKLSETRSTIDRYFDEAVKHVVSTVLKA